MKPYFSVIVPAKNEQALLPHCLTSLRHQTTNKPYEIIVVDGNSTDQTAGVAKQFKVRYILQRYGGKIEGIQQGADAARGDILCFTEADCVLPPNWLATIDRSFARASGTDVITGVYTFSNSTPFYRILARIGIPLIMYIGRLVYGVYPLRNTNLAIKKTVFFAVNGFDIRVKELYDLDLSLRLRGKAGVAFDPSLIVETSDRRIRGRLIPFLFEVIPAIWNVGFLRKPISKETYKTIR